MNEIRPRTRQGFTLVEVLLVLAVVVLVSAMAWPALQRPFASRRLHSAADEVRTQWCEARNEAMRSGHTYAFRYQVGGDRFRVEPQSESSAMASHTGGEMEGLADDEESVALTEEALAPAEEKTLPDGIKFVVDATNDGLSPTLAAGSTSQDGLSDEWSDPILFYPDGTASDVRLVLTGGGNLAVRLLLRGITGTVTVADLTSLVE